MITVTVIYLFMIIHLVPLDMFFSFILIFLNDILYFF